MRLANLFFIVLFLLSAALQYNDPDPYLWIPLYLYGALVCYLAYRYRMTPALFILGWAVYVPYALYLVFNSDGVISWWKDHEAEDIAQGMKATKPWIEKTREFFGLLILITALLANWIWLRQRSAGKTKPQPNTLHSSTL